MDTLGSSFQVEVNKFKFLNELVNKLQKFYAIDFLEISIADSLGEPKVSRRQDAKGDSGSCKFK